MPLKTRAECVLPAGGDLDATLRFFLDELGFRLDAVTPADDPAQVRLSGHGLNLVLDRSYDGDPGMLRLTLPENASREAMTAPNGTRIEFAPADPPLRAPEPRVQARVRKSDDANWTPGRAGMRYRDLVPDRLGGYLIASHIRIPDGGPVPDNVHHHDIRFQFIYCYRGWVRLVYEDQGEPFVMHAGDCVLQPPHIRHRVLEASPGLEVIELACPAEHMTYLDHEMTLPTGRHLPERDYGGQFFVFHQAAKAEWSPLPDGTLEARDLGLAAATHGLVRARVLRFKRSGTSTPEMCEIRGTGAFVFLFVLKGSAEGVLETLPATAFEAGGALLVPHRSRACFQACSPDLEILEVGCPG